METIHYASLEVFHYDMCMIYPYEVKRLNNCFFQISMVLNSVNAMYLIIICAALKYKQVCFVQIFNNLHIKLCIKYYTYEGCIINSQTLHKVIAKDDKHIDKLYHLYPLSFSNIKIMIQQHVNILKFTKVLTILRCHINMMRNSTSQKNHHNFEGLFMSIKSVFL